MLDLYLLLVPTFAIITTLALAALKLALNDSVLLARLKENARPAASPAAHQSQETPFKTVAKHLLLRFSLLELPLLRRPAPKLVLFLGISLTFLVTLLTQSSLAGAAMGSLAWLTYFLSGLLLANGPNFAREKYLQVLYGATTIILNFALIGLTFKNYRNTALSQFIANAGISLAFDHFLARPAVALLLSLPLSRSSTLVAYIEDCQKNEEMVTTGGEGLIGVPGSPSKFNKRIPLEIEPVPLERAPNKQIENYKVTQSLLKQLKQEKMQAQEQMKIQATPVKCNMPDGSLNSLNGSTNKDPGSPVAQITLDPPKESEKQSEPELYLENYPEHYPIKDTNRGLTEHVIKVISSNHEFNDNDDIHTEGLDIKMVTEEESAEGLFSQRNQDHQDPLKISLQPSETPSARDGPLRICLNINNPLPQHYDSDNDDEDDHWHKRRETIAVGADVGRPCFGLLEIKEKQGLGDEIEEIDLNSPERRRRQVHIELEDSKHDAVKLKKKKKMSCDQRNNNRVIKFSTGEPYLEYLPNMLNKDSKTKKSQAFPKKDIVLDNRIVNSVKRPNKKRVISLENNENLVPEFRIEEL